MKKLFKEEKTKENLKVLGAAIGGVTLASIMHIEFAIATLLVIITFIATKKLVNGKRAIIVILVAILVTIASVAFHQNFCLQKNEVADNNVPQITEETTQEEQPEEVVEDQPEAEVSTSKRLRLFNCFRERSNCRLKR